MKKIPAALMLTTFIIMFATYQSSGSVGNEKRLELSLYGLSGEPLNGVKCIVILPKEPIQISANGSDFFCQYIAIGPYVESGISFTKKVKFTDPATGEEKSVTEILGKTEEYWSEHGYWKQFLSVTGDCTSYANYGRNYWSSVPVKEQFAWGDPVSTELKVIEKGTKISVECYVQGKLVQTVLCDAGDPRKLKTKNSGNDTGFVRVCQGVDDTSGKVRYESASVKEIEVLDKNGKWGSCVPFTMWSVYGGSYRADFLDIQFNNSPIRFADLVKSGNKKAIRLVSFSTGLIQ